MCVCVGGHAHACMSVCKMKLKLFRPKFVALFLSWYTFIIVIIFLDSALLIVYRSCSAFLYLLSILNWLSLSRLSILNWLPFKLDFICGKVICKSQFREVGRLWDRGDRRALMWNLFLWCVLDFQRWYHFWHCFLSKQSSVWSVAILEEFW